MIETISELIKDQAKKHSDTRLAVFQIEVKSLENDTLTLAGRVLEQGDLDALATVISEKFSHLLVDTGSIEVLRCSENPTLSVGTNLTSTHNSASFLAEMSSQMVFGENVEILFEDGRWVYTRQSDGYLGYIYNPYLTDRTIPIPTHIVLAPAVELRASADVNAPILTRVFCGTRLKVAATRPAWSQVEANVNGWVPAAALRALDSMPITIEARRTQMIEDARRMIGIPYLWGGTAGNGIDCSGFARLLHNLVGMAIPRDADMQSWHCKPVEPPYHPGDLLFFGEGDTNRHITHVGISLGGWDMIHSSRSRNGVYIDNVQEKDFLRAIFSHAGTFLYEK